MKPSHNPTNHLAWHALVTTRHLYYDAQWRCLESRLVSGSRISVCADRWSIGQGG